MVALRVSFQAGLARPKVNRLKNPVSTLRGIDINGVL